MNLFLYQLKQAFLSLKKKPGFVLSVVSTMGITLGALLCVLTLAYVMLLKPLPYPEQDKLYWVEHGLADNFGELRNSSFSYPGMIHFYEKQNVFSESALLCFGESLLASDPAQPLVNTTFVTPEFFSLTATPIALGRAFDKSEGKDSNSPVALISYDMWQLAYNGNRDVLNKKITINDVSFNIIGVVAEHFIEPEIFTPGRKTQYWLPWDYNFKAKDYQGAWGNVLYELAYVGKLKEGYSQTQAEQKISPFLNDLWQENVISMAFYKDWTVSLKLKSLKSIIIGDNEQRMYLLLAAVLGLLVIAFANISNLFIARAIEQKRSLAINAAVGASKQHIFKSFYAESIVLMLASLALALVITSLGFALLQYYLAEFLPRVNELAINAFTLSSALCCLVILVLIFSKLSSNVINYRALNSSLQSSGKGSGVQVSKKVRQALIISQVAVTTLLVFANLSLFNQSTSIINTPMKYNVEQVYTLDLSRSSLLKWNSDEVLSLLKEIENALLQLPEVSEVSQSNSPMNSNTANFTLLGQETIFSAELQDESGYNSFHLLEQPLLAGDWFSEEDIIMGRKVFVVNDVFAKQLAANGNAVGMKISMENEIDRENNAVMRTIVGVVAGVNLPNKAVAPAQAYWPIWKGSDNFLIKVKPQQNLSREQVVNTVKLVTHKFTLSSLERLSDVQANMLFTQYTTAITSGVLAIFTFLLAAIGLYGILSYSTQIRRFEIATRLAIGAKKHDIVKLIFFDNIKALFFGILVSGLLLVTLYLNFSELLINYLSMASIPPLILTLALISLTAFFACYFPLRQYINKPVIDSLKNSE
ncbi:MULTISPECIES: ABC transporter permease [unclassified Colwellia]|uniref:ABC transporter permease n=1 Tax=unclassified Colwellia TaxID=196834 RepID=UPI0015F4C322|nr:MULTISPECIES: ABC transporter permease [unclassified Colwellia]MBA6234479.1 ABC transporter permease [Colwellia sp. MB02u-7]MBA6236900.1 ABC transporter permease [Colwellia sp. MB02u-11]MBA6256157.1 ABC transporter permease [Colwellia sp. MB3u-28]MBA6260041.1 ABC transporter permease [Colwellia sp. MB3u-41]MBA6299960.1 ABC transporter permease [Colwellia sp. MB3u-22]